MSSAALLFTSYALLNLEIQENRAHEHVTERSPGLSDIELQKIDEIWQIRP